MKHIPLAIFITIFVINIIVFAYTNLMFKKSTGVKILHFKVIDLPRFNMRVAGLNILLLFVFKILVFIVYR